MKFDPTYTPMTLTQMNDDVIVTMLSVCLSELRKINRHLDELLAM